MRSCDGANSIPVAVSLFAGREAFDWVAAMLNSKNKFSSLLISCGVKLVSGIHINWKVVAGNAMPFKRALSVAPIPVATARLSTIWLKIDLDSK